MPTLNLTNSEEEKKEGYGRKIIIFSVVGIILSFIFGFSLNKLLFKELAIIVSAVWPLLISFVLFLVNFSLESLFSQSLRIPFLFLQSLAMVVGFFVANLNKFMLWEAVWVVVLFLLFLFARKTIHSVEEGSLKLKWHHLTRKGVAEVITAILLFVSVSFGAVLWQKAESGFLISEKTLSSVLNSGNFIVRLYYKNFDWNMKVDDFVEVIASKTVDSMIEKTLGKSLDLLPDSLVQSQKTSIIDQSAVSVRNQLSQLAGFTVGGDETIVHVLNQFISNKLNNLPLKVNRIIIAVFPS